MVSNFKYFWLVFGWWRLRTNPRGIAHGRAVCSALRSVQLRGHLREHGRQLPSSAAPYSNPLDRIRELHNDLSSLNSETDVQLGLVVVIAKRFFIAPGGNIFFAAVDRPSDLVGPIVPRRKDRALESEDRAIACQPSRAPGPRIDRYKERANGESSFCLRTTDEWEPEAPEGATTAIAFG